MTNYLLLEVVRGVEVAFLVISLSQISRKWRTKKNPFSYVCGTLNPISSSLITIKYQTLILEKGFFYIVEPLWVI